MKEVTVTTFAAKHAIGDKTLMSIKLFSLDWTEASQRLFWSGLMNACLKFLAHLHIRVKMSFFLYVTH